MWFSAHHFRQEDEVSFRASVKKGTFAGTIYFGCGHVGRETGRYMMDYVE
jgi:hypothetical protein